MESTSERRGLGQGKRAILLTAAALLALIGVSVWWDLGSLARRATERKPIDLGASSALPIGGEDEPRGSGPPTGSSRREELAVESSAGSAEPSAMEEASAVVTTRFLDPSGAPVAGVELWSHSTPEAIAHSAGDGVARLALGSEARSSESVTLTARRAGFAREQRSARLEPLVPLRLGDWVLVPGGGLAGRVVDEDGRALAGVQVACRRESLDEAQWAAARRLPLEGLARPGSRDVSSADGSFVLTDVPAGSVQLVGVAEDRPAGLSEPVSVPAGGWASDVVIRMDPADGGSLLAGVVLAPDGRAAPRASVEIDGGGASYSLTCDERGRFELRATHTELCEVTAVDRARRHGEARLHGVRPGTTDLVLRLGEAAGLELLVRSREGEPIEHFAAAAIAARGAKVLAFLPESERPGGRHRLAIPAQAYLVEVRSNGWKPARLGPFEPGATVSSLEFALDPAGGIQGRVTAQGEPVPGARVGLYEQASANDTHNGFPLRTRTRPEREDVCDSDGRFSLSVERLGTYTLRAEAPDHALAELGPFPLTGDERCEETIELGQGGTLEARVRSTGGESVVGKLVAVSRGDGLAHTRRTDEEGRVRFERLTPGPWQVELSGAEIDPRSGSTYFGTGPAAEIPANCSVSEGEVTHVDLWLEEADAGVCRLEGRLVVDGEPAEGWSASLDSEGGSPGQASIRLELGSFRLATDVPGTHLLTLRCDDPDPGAMLVIREAVALSEGQHTWSLELETGRVEGTLEAGPGLLFHRWRQGSLECFAPLIPGEGGAFRARVPAGPGELVRLDPELPLEDQTPAVLRTLTLAPGETLRL